MQIYLYLLLNFINTLASRNMRSFQFQIAGYIYELQNHSELPIVMETGFETYVCSEKTTADRIITVHHAQQLTPAQEKPSYQAKNDNQLMWQIFTHAAKKTFEIYHPSNGTLQQIAHYDPATKSWEVHSCALISEGEEVLNPLAYPLAPLIWYTLSTEEDLLMIHASGIYDGQFGRIFSGFSGVGKSTLAGIWSANGAQVINDDRLIIKHEADGTWRMYNTPMYYIAEPVSAPLDYIYLPFHHQVNSIELLSGANALASLLANTIHHGYDIDHILHHTRVASHLLKQLPIAKIGVVPDAQICVFLRNHEAAQH